MASLHGLCVCVFSHRAVRGAVVHGDACGSPYGHQPGDCVSGASVWAVCRPHCVHPAGHGGAVGLPPRPQTALVREPGKKEVWWGRGEGGREVFTFWPLTLNVELRMEEKRTWRFGDGEIADWRKKKEVT